ncbi:ThiF family adenylyltransferase [Chloroflexota bacterium]
MSLTDRERERYDRQIIPGGIGEEGQEKLKESRVVIAGSGGLGSPISLYLAAAGVGTLRIVDHGRLERSNLNRQVLYNEEDIDQSKVVSAKTKLAKLNPDIEIEIMEETINAENVSRLVSGCDVIVDAMDSLVARYLLNEAAIKNCVPFIHGAVYGFEGRAMTIIPGKTACLECIYQGIVPPEKKNPVIGITPGVIGCIQAAEVIKYIIGVGKLLTDVLLIYDGLNQQFSKVRVNKNPGCKKCGHLGGK